MAIDTETLVVVLGVLVGVLLRSILPFLKKASEMEKAGQKISFAPKYIATSLLALIIGVITAMQVLTIIDIPPIEDFQDIFSVFIFALTYAYAFQSSLNIIADAKG